MIISENKRLLTVSSKQSEMREHIDPQSGQRTYYVHNLPFIKLAGKWLLNAGFTYGDIIEVETKEDGCLIIKKTTHQWEILGEKPRLSIVNESGEPIQKN